MLIAHIFGGPWAKTRFGKRPKLVEGHWEKLRCLAVYARTQKTAMRKRSKFRWLRAHLKRALLALFWAPGRRARPGGQGPIRKRQFGRHAKTADEKEGSSNEGVLLFLQVIISDRAERRRRIGDACVTVFELGPADRRPGRA